MSLRQIRRMEKMAVVDSDSSDDLPATMMRPNRGAKLKKAKKKQQQQAGMQEESTMEDGPPQEEEKSPVEKSSAVAAVAPEAEEEDEGIIEEDHNSFEDKKKKKSKKLQKQQQREKRRQQEQEDEDLLNQQLAQLGVDPTEFEQQQPGEEQEDNKGSPIEENSSVMPKKSSGKSAESSSQSSPTSARPPQPAQPLVALMSSGADGMRCNPDWMNPRNERIAAFGRNAVEADASSGDSRIFPPRPPNARKPKFRTSPFATPDSNAWPPFSALGARLLKEEGATGSKKVSKKQSAAAAAAAVVLDEDGLPTSTPSHTVVYRFDTNSEEYAAAQRAFEGVVGHFGDMQELLHLWAKQPYHLPTILQLYSTMQVMGEASEAQRLLDMALYATGVFFSACGFPMSATSAARSLPYSIPSNQVIFLTLQRGIQEALKKGCGKTATEMTKLLLSLDESDPMHALLSLDYCALRGSQFRWLQELVLTLKKEKSPLLALPSLHYHAALAAFLERQRASSSSSTGKKKAAAALPPPTAEECRELMVAAVRLFPNAALSIADKVGENITSGTGTWGEFLAVVEGYNTDSTSDQQLKHVTDLFVERSSDLWKPSAVLFELKAAVEIVRQDTDLKRFAARDERQMYLQGGLLDRYNRATAEDVVGESNQRIPQELLQNEATAEEMRDEMRRRDQQLPPHVSEMLQRMEAAFGPLEDPTLSVEERLAMYQSQMEAAHQRLGEEHSPIALFFRSLMGGVDDLALQQAMADRGVEDPVVAERRRRRQLEHQELDRAMAADWVDDDESSSSDSD